ncbi:hypothetical protein BC829DRAFT_378182, partial [Chytridium lagenaria]
MLRAQRMARQLATNATSPKTPYDHLKVIKFGNGEFSSKLVSQKAFKKGEVVASMEGFTKGVVKRWSSVQVDENLHIELNSNLVYMVNHSCAPSVFVDTTDMRIVALKDLSEGSEVTFFYPSTEWKMAQPFKCWCEAKDCVGTVEGAHALTEETLNKFRVNPHIIKLFKKAKEAERKQPS